MKRPGPAPSPARPSIDRRWILPPAIAALVLLADQFSKIWVVQNLGPEPERAQMLLAGNWLSLLYVRNTGVAFGLFQSLPRVFVVTSLLITAGVVVTYIFYLPNRLGWLQICVGLIVGGALGNVIDRIRIGYVIDFIKVGWWPIFNLADSAVTVGILMLAIFLIFFEEERPRAPRPMPRDDALLNELLSQDFSAIPDQPTRRANPGRTDSGRRIMDEE